MNNVIIILIVYILFSSCNTSKQLKEKAYTQSQQDDKPIYGRPLYIFSIPKERVVESIDQILRQDINIYDLENKFISFGLICDTVTGKILSVEVEEDFGFSNCSKKLRDYFISLSPIKCAIYPISGKVSEYYLSVSLVKESINLYIDYGYRDE